MRKAYGKFCYKQHSTVQELYEPLKYLLIRLTFKLYLLLFITVLDNWYCGCHIFLLLLSYKPRSILPNPETHLGEKRLKSRMKKFSICGMIKVFSSGTLIWGKLKLNLSWSQYSQSPFNRIIISKMFLILAKEIFLLILTKISFSR